MNTLHTNAFTAWKEVGCCLVMGRDEGDFECGENITSDTEQTREFVSEAHEGFG